MMLRNSNNCDGLTKINRKKNKDSVDADKKHTRFGREEKKSKQFL